MVVLPGVGARGEHERVVAVREAGGVHERVALARERPAQDRLDDVRVEHMGRALEQRSGQYLDALSHLGDLHPEAEGPEAFGVPEAARAVAVAAAFRESGEAAVRVPVPFAQWVAVPVRLGRAPFMVVRVPLRRRGRCSAARSRMWPIRTRIVGRLSASGTMNRWSSGSRTSDVTVTMPWMS